MAYKPQYRPGSTIVHSIPIITEQPLGAPTDCQRKDCKGCPKITPCRETFERSLPARAGD